MQFLVDQVATVCECSALQACNAVESKFGVEPKERPPKCTAAFDVLHKVPFVGKTFGSSTDLQAGEHFQGEVQKEEWAKISRGKFRTMSTAMTLNASQQSEAHRQFLLEEKDRRDREAHRETYILQVEQNKFKPDSTMVDGNMHVPWPSNPSTRSGVCECCVCALARA